MPTLAREYDYHFKEFNNVPVNLPANTSLYTANAASTKSDDRSSIRSKYSRFGNNNNNNANNNTNNNNNSNNKSRVLELEKQIQMMMMVIMMRMMVIIIISKGQQIT